MSNQNNKSILFLYSPPALKYYINIFFFSFIINIIITMIIIIVYLFIITVILKRSNYSEETCPYNVLPQQRKTNIF